jgi:hypothetical protein
MFIFSRKNTSKTLAPPQRRQCPRVELKIKHHVHSSILGDSPFWKMALVCGFLVLLASDEQFHLWLWNWCWHSLTDCANPWRAARVASGCPKQSSIWALVSPGVVLQMVVSA